jgi:hypothetical protein
MELGLTTWTTLANRHEMRAYDDVQLAAALELNRISQGGTVLVSSDRDLNRAATAERLIVDDHTTHHASVTEHCRPRDADRLADFVGEMLLAPVKIHS